MSGKVLVPASTSNLGAGFDCFGIAIDLWLEAELYDGEGPAEYSGTLAGLSQEEDLIAGILVSAGAAEGSRLRVHSDIPVSRGLGSSGAAAVAAYSLATLKTGATFDLDLVYELAARIEGHPDNVGASVYGGALLSARRPTRVPFSPELALAFAIPDQSISTEDARRILPETVPRQTAVGQAARAAALIRGIQNADPELIAFGMDDRLAVPLRRDLIRGYDVAVAAAEQAGAYGTTISGSGSTLVAITGVEKARVVSEAMAFALTEEGNSSVPFTTTVSERGAHFSY